jgi:hypothetical protein
LKVMKCSPETRTWSMKHQQYLSNTSSPGTANSSFLVNFFLQNKRMHQHCFLLWVGFRCNVTMDCLSPGLETIFEKLMMVWWWCGCFRKSMEKGAIPHVRFHGLAIYLIAHSIKNNYIR